MPVEALLALVAFGVVAVVATRPLAGHLESRVIGVPTARRAR